MDPDRQISKIRTIACLDELSGYEAEARRRGVLPEEMAAIERKRAELERKIGKRHVGSR